MGKCNKCSDKRETSQGLNPTPSPGCCQHEKPAQLGTPQPRRLLATNRDPCSKCCSASTVAAPLGESPAETPLLSEPGWVAAVWVATAGPGGERGGQDSRQQRRLWEAVESGCIFKVGPTPLMGGLEAGGERGQLSTLPGVGSVCFTDPVLRGHGQGRAGVGREAMASSPLSTGSPWGSRQSWDLHWGWDGVPGQRPWEERQARALEHWTLRSGVEGGAHHGTGGQGLGRNLRSCPESISARPRRTLRELPADRLSEVKVIHYLRSQRVRPAGGG